MKDVSGWGLRVLAESYFGATWNNGSSHVVLKTSWAADPRIKIQLCSGQTKPYQVKQARAAIDTFKEHSND